MATAIAIQRMAQTSAGMPVALAMLTASVGTEGANGDERKNTVFKSSRALSMHWTASRLTKKVATRGLAYLAIAIRPRLSSVPARIVNGSAEETTPVMAGLMSP